MDEEPAPPGGFPMRWAITALAAGEAGKVWVESYEAAPRYGGGSAEDRWHLWIRLVHRARAGEVVFRGVRDGTSEPTVIDAGTLLGSTPDFDADTLIAAGILWHSVSVDRIQPIAVTSQPPTGHDFAYLVGRAAEWMHRNVTAYSAKQRDRRVSECCRALKDIQMSKDAALSGWNSLPPSIKGPARGSAAR